MDPDPADATVARLHAEQPPFDWVGVYWVDGEDLVLGPYRGIPPEHVRIRIPDGVCGAVAAAGETEVVADVRARPGHIACDIHTRSEVVAPIVRDGRVIGVLDVDSNVPDAFGPDEVRIVEAAAAAIAAGVLRPA
jgi:GAF domain-containing protein